MQEPSFWRIILISKPRSSRAITGRSGSGAPIWKALPGVIGQALARSGDRKRAATAKLAARSPGTKRPGDGRTGLGSYGLAVTAVVAVLLRRRYNRVHEGETGFTKRPQAMTVLDGPDKDPASKGDGTGWKVKARSPPGSGVVIGRAGGKTRGAGQGWSVLLGSAMAIVLGLTACGGGSPRSLGAAAGGSTTTAQPASSSGSSGSSAASLGLTYARCMRSHGVPNFPDPSAGGGSKTALSNTDIDQDSPAYEAAGTACHKYFPNGNPTPPTPAQQARRLAERLKYAQCMRSHGVTKFPDPDSYGVFGLLGPAQGVDPNSPTFQAAEKACQSLPAAPGQHGHGG